MRKNSGNWQENPCCPWAARLHHPNARKYSLQLAAFTFAATLAWFYPQLRWMFWILAVGCAASRWIEGLHWPSDCLAGAVIGYLAACLAIRLVRARPQ